MLRSIRTYLSLVAIGVAALASPALAGSKDFGAPERPEWVAGYAGFDVAKDAYYLYSGAVVSLQRDLSRSGLVLQVFSGHGGYEYDNVAVPGGTVDGDLLQFSAMLGYMFVGPQTTVGLYVGVDYQDHDLSPNDPTNSVSGSETGVKFGGDIRFNGAAHMMSLEGYYSTAFDSYWARARIGAKVGRFTFGPEGAALGSESYDAQRVGGFLSINLGIATDVSTELTLSGGYQFVSDDGTGQSGGEGAYGGVNLSFAY